MINIEQLPEQLRTIYTIYLTTEANAEEQDEYNEEFHDEFIELFLVRPLNLQEIKGLLAYYRLDELEDTIYWELINHIALEECLDNLFFEFLLYLVYFKALANDPLYIALTKLIDLNLKPDFTECEGLNELLIYALDYIHQDQDGLIIKLVDKYKNHEYFLTLLFAVISETEHVAIQAKARVFDLVIANNDNNPELPAELFLREFYIEPIINQWFHLLNSSSQAAIHDYLNHKDTPASLYWAMTENIDREELQDYIDKHQLKIMLTKPDYLLPKPHMCDISCDHLSLESATTFVRDVAKVGRNDPCPCGSGKKYKKCCLNKVS